MFQEPTRRDFLKLSAVGLAAAASASSLEWQPGASAAPRPSEVKNWVTAGDSRFAPQRDIAWEPAADSPSSESIVLDSDKKYQDILGFGGAFTDAACYMFNQLDSGVREALFRELFHPSEMGLNVCRTCIGASDYATKVYSYADDGPDPELVRFSIAHDREYILPMLRLARKMNPELLFFSSPWSPPGWMKFNGSMLGGSMRRKYLPNYAQYFLKFLRAYAAEGVAIQAVTPQNEVDTDQDGRMPACTWPQEYEIEFVAQHLGPLLNREGMATKIWILDHNYNLWGRAICELDDTALRQHCDAVAWHGYAGTPEMMSKVHDAHPTVSMHWTEGGPDFTSPDYATDWTNWAQTFIAALRNWCRSITGWNLALDEGGRPNIGPFSCGGTLTIHSKTKEIIRSGQYWAFAHFARCVRRGARRFDSQSNLREIDHVALENPDGSKVLVISNSGPSRSAGLRMRGQRLSLQLEGHSITTLLWN